MPRYQKDFFFLPVCVLVCLPSEKYGHLLTGNNLFSPSSIVSQEEYLWEEGWRGGCQTMVGCISKSRGSTVPLPHEIMRLELYRKPQSAERQHYQAGSLETPLSQIRYACGFCSLSHTHCPLENVEGKGKKYN